MKEEHIPTCAILEIRPCPANKAMYGEQPDQHWWSGWPGAYCMKCGDEDKVEVCLGGCECPCHDEFWEDYNNALIESQTNCASCKKLRTDCTCEQPDFMNAEE